ncbi:MAG: M24 family metallopeptidase [Pseudomonadota bacterium]
MPRPDPLRLAKTSPGFAIKDHEGQIDMVRLRGYRLGRLQAQLKRLDIAAAVLYDPINIRYATGSRNMAVWTLHNPARYCFVPAAGRCVLFDFHGCGHLSDGLETIGEVRPARSWFFYSCGNRLAERVREWANQMADLFRERCGAGARIAIDHIDPPGWKALEALGFEIVDAQEPCELARAVKSSDEIACMSQSIAVCEAGMARMHEALRPGLTENELWALLCDTNIRLGGEWMETRLLASGGRTNPWFKECGERVIRPGDLVAFDTDLIGPFGYCADLSRTFLCGPNRATPEQRQLYGLALEQIHANLELVKPGISMAEFADQAWRIPDAYAANRYSGIAHGVGLCDEWPRVPHRQDFAASGYDAVLEPNMTICIESYVGEEGGAEGVKLEQQVLVTETGYQILSTFPFEDKLGG